MANSIQNLQTHLEASIDKKAKQADERMDAMQMQLLEFRRELDAVKAANTCMDVESDSSGPAPQPKSKKARSYLQTASSPAQANSGGGSSNDAAPAATGPKPRKFSIFVGGFGRPIAKELRVGHSKVLLGKLSTSLAAKATVRAEFLAKFYHMDFPDSESLHSALDELRTTTHMWLDPSYNDNQKLIIKKDKPIEQRKVLQFCSHFYELMQNIVEELKDHEALKDKQHKLKIINQQLFLAVDDDWFALIAFRKQANGTMVAVPNHKACLRLGIAEERVDALVRVAAARAEQQAV